MFLNSHKVIKVHFQPFQTQMDEGSILPVWIQDCIQLQHPQHAAVITTLPKMGVWLTSSRKIGISRLTEEYADLAHKPAISLI